MTFVGVYVAGAMVDRVPKWAAIQADINEARAFLTRLADQP